MLGDQSDMLYRMKQVLPLGWFPDSSPVLDTLMSGAAWAWAWVYQTVQYARHQARIATAEQTWLDLIAVDFFGAALPRRGNESDTAYRSRIQAELIRERGTRAAVVAALTDLTGREPIIFEPAYAFDTGGFGGKNGGGGGLGYATAGGWGSLSLPMQFFATAYRPTGSGIANVAGWACAAGGYCCGALEYGNLDMVQGQVTDADIYTAIGNVLPIGVIAWTRISN